MTSDQMVALLVLAVGAFLAPLVSRRIGIPASVGEILLGALIANLIGPLANTGVPGALGFVGFAVLMFTAGLEIDFDRIERGGAGQLVVALIYVAVSTGGTVALVVIRGDAPILGIAYGVTSIGIAVAAMREANVIGGRIGQTVLLVGGLGEFVSMLALTGIDLVSRSASGPVSLQLIKLLGALILVYLVLVVLRSLVWWSPESFERLVDAKDPSEVGIRAALALMLAFVAAAALLGLEPILGAFLAGAVFSLVFRSSEPLTEKLTSVGYGFLIPIFFIGVGQDLRWQSLIRPSVVVPLGIALVVTVLAKVLAAPVLRLAGLSWHSALTVAVFLAAPLTLQVAIARLGADLHLLSQTDATALIVASVFSGVIMPSLARRLSSRAEQTV